MKIVILAGGTSTERDVSLCTGEKVYEALTANGHEAVLLDVYLGYETNETPKSLFQSRKNCIQNYVGISNESPDLSTLKSLRADGGSSFFGPNVLFLCSESDLVFMALHGSNGEDGRIQATFDLMGIKYTGTNHLSSAIAMDKALSKQLFLANNIPTPRGITLHNDDSPVNIGENVGFPCMIKTCCGGSSVGVYRANNEDEAQKAIKEGFEYEDTLIIEQYITGREFSVGVLDGHALPIIEIAPLEGFYDYKNKYQAGSTIETCPAKLDSRITNQMQHFAELVYSALSMEAYARMDFMLDGNTNAIYCLEANTLPGMTPTSLLPQEAAATGISFPELCEKLISISLKKYED